MMERLTRNGFDYCAEYCASSADCGFFKHEVPTPCGDAAIYNRLAAYEDTGLEPGEIKSLVAEFHVNLAALDSYRKAKKAKTNADKIRQMSDEELAEYLGVKLDGCAGLPCVLDDNTDCQNCVARMAETGGGERWLTY